jgi:hypothetical protein
MQPLNITLRLRLGLLADLRVERPSRVLLQLLLPGIDLVRMHLIPLRQVGYTRLLPQRLKRNLRLQRRIAIRSCQTLSADDLNPHKPTSARGLAPVTEK